MYIYLLYIYYVNLLTMYTTMYILYIYYVNLSTTYIYIYYILRLRGLCASEGVRGLVLFADMLYQNAESCTSRVLYAMYLCTM